MSKSVFSRDAFTPSLHLSPIPGVDHMNIQKMKEAVRIVLMLTVVIFVIPFLPLLISRRWNWWEAWVFAGIFILGFIVSRILVAQRTPDLISERAHFQALSNVKSWDKILAPLVGVGSGIIPAVAGFEALYGPNVTFGMPVKIMALILIVSGYVLGSYAMYINRFFSGYVRIQSDRGHTVISEGPYRWIRHPGYTGSVMSFLAIPLFLDSIWAFVPALAISLVLIIRTRLEDYTLQEELTGYKEYAEKVRYRLFPKIW
jgi:protein-S-isoprenylcysteine O-methyltransferase Ste14